jgi:uncharacterized membrane protein YjdF
VVILFPIRGLWDVLVTAWLILKETAPVWLSAFAVVFAVMSLVGGPACVR